MIPAKIRYATYNGELLAIVKSFKTERHYLKEFQYEVLILIDHNNFWQFMNKKFYYILYIKLFIYET